jgi:acyl-CoA dehydrogenase
MNFEYSKNAVEWQSRLLSFMDEHIYPREQAYRDFTSENEWQEFPDMEFLKNQAQSKGLWNLFLPKEYKPYSPGLSNLEYAPLAEIMGRVLWSSQVFNCSAPDTGNMEVLARYGSEEQKKHYLTRLFDGSIRSAFLMTEPDVASSDASNIQCSIEKKVDHYLVNGRKWWSTGAMHPKVALFIVMGKTNPEADKYHQQSMILVPADAEGITIVRPLKVFGFYESPEGHAEINLENVKVPLENIILKEGAGFSIAQGRLGPGRIHHCMRLIGTAQRAMEMMCARANERRAFGKSFGDFSSIREIIATSRCEIEQARLLTLAAADKIDRAGNKEAKDLIAMIKIVVPSMACRVVDRAIQIHGGLGFCQDTPLAEYYAYARVLRMADGPDEVHRYQLGRNMIKKFSS